MLLTETLRRKGIFLEQVPEGEGTLLQAPFLSSPGKLLEYALGYFHPQALTSCLVSLALPVKPDAFVLDMCASPGGKTSHLAARMGNKGLVVANELYPARQVPLAHTLARLGVMNTVITGYQAQEFPLRQRFDYVLADVPCSGEGRFRFRTSHSYYYEEKGSKGRLAALQRRIILRAFDLLKSNGEMLYASCTYNPEENEGVVEFLLRQREAELLPIHLTLQADPGLTAWKGEVYDRRMERALRFYPHQVDSVGFFMARIGKP